MSRVLALLPADPRSWRGAPCARPRRTRPGARRSLRRRRGRALAGAPGLRRAGSGGRARTPAPRPRSGSSGRRPRLRRPRCPCPGGRRAPAPRGAGTPPAKGPEDHARERFLDHPTRITAGTITFYCPAAVRTRGPPGGRGGHGSAARPAHREGLRSARLPRAAPRGRPDRPPRSRRRPTRPCR